MPADAWLAAGEKGKQADRKEDNRDYDRPAREAPALGAVIALWASNDAHSEPPTERERAIVLKTQYGITTKQSAIAAIAACWGALIVANIVAARSSAAIAAPM